MCAERLQEVCKKVIKELPLFQFAVVNECATTIFEITYTKEAAEAIIRSGKYQDGRDGIGPIYLPLPQTCKVVPFVL
jgi:hypothetical protein